jgi:hypothetical protein
MSVVLEAEARISATDNTGGAFNSIAGKAKNLASALGNIDKSIGKGGVFTTGWSERFEREISKLKISANQLAKLQQEFLKFDAQLHAGPIKASKAFAFRQEWEDKQLASLRRIQAAYQQHNTATNQFALAQRGAMRLFYAAGGLYGLERAGRYTFDRMADQSREQTKQYQGGMTPQEQAETAAKARELSQRYPSIGQTEVAEHIRLLRGRFGDFHHAMGAVDDLVRAQVVLGTLGKGDGGADLERLVLGMESKGLASNPETFRNFLNAFVKAKSLFPDLRGEDFRAYLQNSKSSAYALSDKYLQTKAPTLMQHEGAEKFGTMQATAFSALIGGHQTKAAWAQLNKLGLAKGKELIDKGSFLTDPDEWSRQHLDPVLAKRGITWDGNREGYINELAQLFSSRNTAEFFAALRALRQIIDKDQPLLAAAKGTEAASDVRNRDLLTASSGVLEQLNNAIQNLASPQTQRAADALNGLADGIGRIAKFLGDNQEKVKKVEDATIDVAGAALKNLMPPWLKLGIAGYDWAFGDRPGRLGMMPPKLRPWSEATTPGAWQAFHEEHPFPSAPTPLSGGRWPMAPGAAAQGQAISTGMAAGPSDVRVSGELSGSVSGQAAVSNTITVQPSPLFDVHVREVAQNIVMELKGELQGMINNGLSALRNLGGPATGTTGATGKAMPEAHPAGGISGGGGF